MPGHPGRASDWQGSESVHFKLLVSTTSTVTVVVRGTSLNLACVPVCVYYSSLLVLLLVVLRVWLLYYY